MGTHAVESPSRTESAAAPARLPPPTRVPTRDAGLRSSLRGMSYEEGAAALSPRASEAAAPAAAPARLGGAGSTVTADGGSVTIDAPNVVVNAGTVQLNASVTRAQGVLQADTLLANSVVSSSYTPGAGNAL